MQDISRRVLELAMQIQQIPAPTFGEQQRARRVHDLWVAEHLLDVSMDALHNVYGRWSPRKRGAQARPLVISAHLDTVFPLETRLDVRREQDRIYGAGLGDNALGVAALFGLVWMLRARKINAEREIWFVANTCEEGLGDLRGMKAVVARFGADVQAYLVLEGSALGRVYHSAVGVRRYRVTLRTAGGHSWSDYGRPSAVHELARVITQITSLPLPSAPRTTLNVGRMHGGTGVNVLAAEATMELDLRSESPQALRQLIERVEGVLASTTRPGVALEVEIIGERPAGELAVDHPLIQLARDCLRTQGLEPELTCGSTDANIPLSQGYPALVLGVTRGGGAHTLEEYIEIDLIAQGMAQLARFVERV